MATKIECLSNYVRVRDKVYPCTTSLVMDLIGGKWKASILYHLQASEKRYNELRKEMPSVTEMTLSLQLKQLEKDGLITREAHGDKPPIKVIYSLTDFGRQFIPVLEAITNCGNQIVVDQGEFVGI